MVQQPFHIEELSGGPTERRVLRLSGPLWLASVQQFQTVVRAEEDRGLILDVTGVPIVDSAGIAALVAEAIIHQKQGHRLRWSESVNGCEIRCGLRRLRSFLLISGRWKKRRVVRRRCR